MVHAPTWGKVDVNYRSCDASQSEKGGVPFLGALRGGAWSVGTWVPALLLATLWGPFGAWGRGSSSLSFLARRNGTTSFACDVEFLYRVYLQAGAKQNHSTLHAALQ